MLSPRPSCVPGRLWTMMKRKTQMMRTPSTADRLTPPSARAQVCSHFVHLHLSSLIAFFFASSLKNRLISSPVRPPLLYPSIPRCSDFLLLPQTLPHPILSQKRNASLRLMVTRLRPLTVPWAPAAAACPVVRLLLIMTPIQPRLIHPFYPSTT